MNVNTVWFMVVLQQEKPSCSLLSCGASWWKVGVTYHSSAGPRGRWGGAATVLPPVSHGAGQPCGGDPSHAAGAAGLWPAPSRTSSVIISKLLPRLSPELFIFKTGVSRERWPHPECVSAQHELCFAGAL